MLLCLLLAISLSVDAFSTGIAYGLRQIQFPFLSRFCIALETFLLLALFLLAGSFFAALFPIHLAEYIAILFLFCFGLWLCLQCCIKQKETKTGFLSFLQQPSRCDKNHSAVLEPKEALLLGLVLSADACGVGISVSVGGFSVFFLPFFASVIVFIIGYILRQSFTKCHKMQRRICHIAFWQHIDLHCIISFFFHIVKNLSFQNTTFML